ncbi:MAG: TIGR04013 family B12-binding domain/radical SAM domain-containing protein [Candidatus Thorarchaeota archaeon]|nr:TIGR04013 family B12-binding domain/radical SAM domain-containing protein [Candidatus Thorarchaeota archaeon]
MCPHSLLFRTHPSSRYSVAALIGVLETDPRLLDLEIRAPITLTDEDIQRSVKEGSAIIAHSVMSTQTKRIYEEVKRVREKYGNRVTLVGGGPHASARPKELLSVGFDYVVIGEGEHTFPELVAKLLSGEDPLVIPGVVGRDSEVWPQPRDIPIVNLDKYPPFALGNNIVGPIEVTRGCPFQCKFCCTPFLTGCKVRHRSVASITKWLALAVERSGYTRAWFLSPNALSYGGRGMKAEPEKLETLLRESTKVEGLNEVFFGSFPSEVRPEFVTQPILEMLRSYVANTSVQIGLQSSSDRILALANRHHNVEQGMRAVRIALDSGFTPHVDMIFGLPGETKKELHESIELCYTLVDMGAKTHGHVFMPLPGSAYEKMPPGQLDSESRRRLGDLSRRKKMTGAWSTQEGLAEFLWSQNRDSKNKNEPC